MIHVTDINQTQFYLNSDMIERIESVPDTILVLSNGRHYVVRESVTEILRRIVDQKRRVRHFTPRKSRLRPGLRQRVRRP